MAHEGDVPLYIMRIFHSFFFKKKWKEKKKRMLWLHKKLVDIKHIPVSAQTSGTVYIEHTKRGDEQPQYSWSSVKCNICRIIHRIEPEKKKELEKTSHTYNVNIVSMYVYIQRDRTCSDLW